MGFVLETIIDYLMLMAMLLLEQDYLKRLWAGANLSERRQLLLSMLDAVYFETKQTKSLIAVRPKPPFKPVFQVAATKEGSGIHIINEPYLGSSVFVVEAGESWSRPETTFAEIMKWFAGSRFSLPSTIATLLPVCSPISDM
jgi:hypothetical protein